MPRPAKPIEPKIHKTNATVGGVPIVALVFPKQKKNYTREQAEDLINEYKAQFKNRPYNMMVSIHLLRDYRSMKAFKTDTNTRIKIDLYGEESDSFDQFVIYMFPQKGYKGGDDEHNDCLFIAIMKAYNI